MEIWDGDGDGWDDEDIATDWQEKEEGGFPILNEECGSRNFSKEIILIAEGQNLLMGSLFNQLQVEPQEKKKDPKGRAMKRLKYTRRFVNVTMTGGKRKVR